MGQKDLSERRLFELNDVFADVVNGLIFSGQNIVRGEELADISVKSNLRTDSGKLTYQERDVSKLWKKKGVVISLLGVENQTKIDKDMIIRIMGYDYASYKNQKSVSKLYPVITIVLYYGKQYWKSPLSLRERMNIPKELEEMVSDYKANVYNLGTMPDKEIERLRGDFKIVVDFLKNGDTLKVKEENITHLPEMLDFFGAFLGDKRFEELKKNIMDSDKERGGNMCDIKEVLDRIENRGKEQGIRLGEERGIKLGEEQGILSSIRKLMSNLKMNLEQALDTLEISEEEKPKYREMIKIENN